MRTLTDHKLNGVNEALEIQVIDQPGQGGACHRYNIRPVNLGNETDPIGTSQRMRACSDIHFQEGPVNEHGINGVTQEALLAIVIDRLRSFQAGEYKCRENAIALTHFEEGLMWLQKRTRDRMVRGVEGTMQK
jgi:hypothetical protein